MFQCRFKRVCAGVAQLAERKLPKLEVASSNLVARSISLVYIVEGWGVDVKGSGMPAWLRQVFLKVGSARFFLCPLQDEGRIL